MSQSFSQEYTDTNPSLTISTNSDNNFIYRDSEGYAVVIGFIENNDCKYEKIDFWRKN